MQPSPGTTVRLLRRIAPAAVSHTSNAVPAASMSPGPYGVRRYPVINGQTLVVGHDAAGEPLIEVRVPMQCFSPGLVEKIQAWCRENDPHRLQIAR